MGSLSELTPKRTPDLAPPDLVPLDLAPPDLAPPKAVAVVEKSIEKSNMPDWEPKIT